MIHKIDNTLTPKDIYRPERYGIKQLVNKLQQMDKPFVENSTTPQLYVKGILGYFESCWAHHRIAVVTPDIILQLLLAEIAGLVKQNPEKYRQYFSTSDEKQEIIVMGYIDLEVDTFIAELKKRVPSNVDTFLPTFSTSTALSQLANKATFMDMVSPFYSYGMMMCGIPAIDVRGTQEDWDMLFSTWQELGKLFLCKTDPTYYANVNKHLINIHGNDWGTFIYFTPCGSGSQVEVSGWILDLYAIKDKHVSFVSNFSDSIGVVEYKQLDLGKTFKMYAGILGVNDDGTIFEPVWSTITFDITDTVAFKPENAVSFSIETKSVIAQMNTLLDTWTVES